MKNIKPVALLLGMSLVCVLVPVNSKDIVVGNVNDLVIAVMNASSGDTILLEDGTYRLHEAGTHMIWVSADDVTIRSRSGDRERVIIEGKGMIDGSVECIFKVDADNFTVRDMTVQKVRYHAIQMQDDADGILIKNLIIRDTGEQMVKVFYQGGNPDSSDKGIMEDCLLEYTAGAGSSYEIGGIDVCYANAWIVRNNIFKNIRNPGGFHTAHAIHFWPESKNTIVEGNLIINCDWGIGFERLDKSGLEGHKRIIICNNMIYHGHLGKNDYGRAGLRLELCADTEVYNNTIYLEHIYPDAIEYCGEGTTGLFIANNLTNKKISSYMGAIGTESCNIIDAKKDWFVDADSGDLHLIRAEIPAVVDQGLTIPSLILDFDGEIRLPTKGIDIGADEFNLKLKCVVGVIILSPKDKEKVSGKVKIRVKAGCDIELDRVKLYIDDVLVHTEPVALQKTAEFCYKWDSKGYPAGWHTIRAVAYSLTEEAAADQIRVKKDDPPKVKITSPKDGAIVSGKVKIRAKVTDDDGIKKVEFYVNGDLKYTDRKEPYVYKWSSVEGTDKDKCGEKYCIKVIAYDTANQKASDTIKVKEDSPPKVKITSPKNGEHVEGIVNIRAQATDDVGIKKVEFHVDGVLKYKDKEKPYVYKWDSNSAEASNVEHISGKKHILKVIAYDTAGKNASDKIKVYTKDLKLTLQATRVEEEIMVAKNEYGKIDLIVEGYESYSQISKYIFYRKEGSEGGKEYSGGYQPLKEISAQELQDGTYSFDDKYLETGKKYTYKAEAVSSDGITICVSNEVTI